jgi:PKD repeat protein
VADLLPASASGNVPLTVNFNASGSTTGGDPGDSIVKYEWDWDGDGSWDVYSEDSSISHIYTGPGAFTARLRVTDEAGNQATDTSTVNATVAGNNAPVADLLPASSSGNIPLTVNFNASGSNAGGDTGDSIVLYEWDFDGNGNFDGYGTDATISHTYSSAGSFTPRLRVTDEAGNQASDTGTVNASVAGNNPPVAVIEDSISLGGVEPYLMITDGELSNDGGDPGDSIVKYEWDFEGDGAYDSVSEQPQVQHMYEHVSSNTLVLRVTDSAGNQDTDSSTVFVQSSSLLVNTAGDLGTTVSMTMVLGNPAVAFSDQDAQRVYYIRALDGSGQTWGNRIEVDNVPLVASGLDLLVVNGTPAIAFYNSPTSELMYVRATTTTGSIWGTPLVLDTQNNTGFFPSMAIINGRPAIAYHYLTQRDLRYLRSNDANGAAWPAPSTIDSAGSTGVSPNLALVDGRPAISYEYLTDKDFRFVHATDAEGTVWDPPQLLETEGDVGENSAILVLGTSTLIAYEDETNLGLRVIRSSNSQATAWNPSELIATGSIGATDISLAFVNNNPAVAYRDGANVRYLRALDADGLNWGPRLLITNVDGLSELLVCAGLPALADVDTFFGDGSVSFSRWE